VEISNVGQKSERSIYITEDGADLRDRGYVAVREGDFYRRWRVGYMALENEGLVCEYYTNIWNVSLVPRG
jgi:hypothetical protein